MLNFLFITVSVILGLFSFLELGQAISNIIDNKQYTDESSGFTIPKTTVKNEINYHIYLAILSLGIFLSCIFGIKMTLFDKGANAILYIIISIISIVMASVSSKKMIEMRDFITNIKNKSKSYKEYTEIDHEQYKKSKRNIRFLHYAYIYNIFYIIMIMLS